MASRRFAPWTDLVPTALFDAEGERVDPHPIVRAFAGQPTPVTVFAVGAAWWELGTLRDRAVEGTGLGLAIVAKLAGLNGVTVRYDVGDHAGTRFVVRLRRAASDRAADPAASVAVPGDERLDT